MSEASKSSYICKMGVGISISRKVQVVFELHAVAIFLQLRGYSYKNVAFNLISGWRSLLVELLGMYGLLKRLRHIQKCKERSRAGVWLARC